MEYWYSLLGCNNIVLLFAMKNKSLYPPSGGSLWKQRASIADLEVVFCDEA
jgi:hypothetical protein